MRQKILILSIITLAAFLRFVNLGQNPPGLYWDEVSLGYNAYSILKTGRDEHAELLPYSRFKAFGDYKPVGYIYATVPSIAVFGLNNFAVRFPSALAGVLTVLFTYLLVKQLFSHFPSTPGVNVIALLSALLLAISPWHLQLSRAAFEANLAALFNVIAIYLFLKSRNKPWLLSLSAISFTATLYTFNSNRLLSPLLIVLLTVIFFKHLLAHKKATLVAAFIGIILTLPLIPHLRSPEGKLRWREVNIFSNLNVILDSNRRIQTDGGGLLARLSHHRYLGHTRNFLRHYFDHFDGRYLFLTGDPNPRFSIQDTGELYLIEAPLLLLGLYSLIRLKNSKPAILLVLGWFLLGPIPAATARETPHALRTLSMLPAPYIIISLGIIYLFKVYKKNRKLLSLLICSGYLLSLTYFQVIYYRYYPDQYSGEWLTSYPKLVSFLQNSPAAAQAKTISIVPDLGRPYIYFLFYNQYPPQKYWQSVNRTGDVFGFFQVKSFDKYQFTRRNPDDIAPGDLYVVKSVDQHDGFEELAVIDYFKVLKKT